jgi:hypothetical protein
LAWHLSECSGVSETGRTNHAQRSAIWRPDKTRLYAGFDCNPFAYTPPIFCLNPVLVLQHFVSFPFFCICTHNCRNIIPCNRRLGPPRASTVRPEDPSRSSRTRLASRPFPRKPYTIMTVSHPLRGLPGKLTNQCPCPSPRSGYVETLYVMFPSRGRFLVSPYSHQTRHRTPRRRCRLE